MYAQQKAVENSYIVRERDRQRFRELLAVCSLAFPLAAFLLLFTWQNIEVIRLGREASRLSQLESELEHRNRALVLEMESRTALTDVQNRAGELGLEPIPRSQLIVVDYASEEAAE